MSVRWYTVQAALELRGTTEAGLTTGSTRSSESRQLCYAALKRTSLTITPSLLAGSSRFVRSSAFCGVAQWPRCSQRLNDSITRVSAYIAASKPSASSIRSSQCLATNAQLGECTVVLIVDCAGSPVRFPGQGATRIRAPPRIWRGATKIR